MTSFQIKPKSKWKALNVRKMHEISVSKLWPSENWVGSSPGILGLHLICPKWNRLQPPKFLIPRSGLKSLQIWACCAAEKQAHSVRCYEMISCDFIGVHFDEKHGKSQMHFKWAIIFFPFSPSLFSFFFLFMAALCPISTSATAFNRFPPPHGFRCPVINSELSVTDFQSISLFLESHVSSQVPGKMLCVRQACFLAGHGPYQPAITSSSQQPVPSGKWSF